jgi:hypothetical protein
VDKSKSFVGVIDDALAASRWFNNHSAGLALLQEEMRASYNKTLALLGPATTRWTGHYISSARMCEVESAMRCLVQRPAKVDALVVAAGTKKKQKDEARRIVSILARDSFWVSLRW